MLNPNNIAVTVPFQGKTYTCDLTLAAIPQVENELNIGILCPTANSLWGKPEFFQRAVLLYLLLKSKAIPGLSLARCSAEVVGDNALRLAGVCREAAEKLQPHIMRLNGIEPPPEDDRPTDGPSSGSDSGPSES